MCVCVRERERERNGALRGSKKREFIVGWENCTFPQG